MMRAPTDTRTIAMAYATNPLLGAVAPPPVAEVYGWIDGREFPHDKPLLDVSQAVPGYPPDKALTDHLARLVSDPATSLYTDIQGTAPLRAALASHTARLYNGTIEADEVAITAGCNQAFCLAIMALAKPGDEVILPVPYYFNHRMWLDMQGLVPVYMPFHEDRGGVPDAADVAVLITPRTRAIVLTTPNNPTGAVFSDEDMDAFFEAAKAHGIALVVDETYRDFLTADKPPHGLFARPDWRDALVHLYSFSKVYCLTGYRVGAIIAGDTLLSQEIKAMDCISICAPAIAQAAALFGLEHLAGWRDDKRALMEHRVEALQQAFRRNDMEYEIVSAGAYFAYLKHPFGDTPSADVARRLADDHNVLCIPGGMFGPGQEQYVRFAFANLDAEFMPALAARLVASQEAL
jgi:aspartate/methionine/tyrosine aminotransferase